MARLKLFVRLKELAGYGVWTKRIGVPSSLSDLSFLSLYHAKLYPLLSLADP